MENMNNWLLVKTRSCVNVGQAPMIRASVVNPKANPFFPGNISARQVSVIGMVKLKKKAPMMAMNGTREKNASKGAETISPVKATLVHPYRSPRIPPKAFPNATPHVRTTSKTGSDFQGIIRLNPTTPLIPIETSSNRMMVSNNLKLPGNLWWASVSAPYLEKSNASLASAALDLPDGLRTCEIGGTLRAGTQGIISAWEAISAARAETFALNLDRGLLVLNSWFGLQELAAKKSS